MIYFEHVSKRYTDTRNALTDLSFRVRGGEMVFLTGHSGAGKSTLLKLITLIERPTRGRIIVNDKEVSRVKRRHVPYYRRQIGVVFQDHKLLTDRTVFDNVALPLIIQGLRMPDISRRVRAALDQVGLLERANDPPIGLSSGEQQRVGIARAIINRPPVVVADEPTGNLDPTLSRSIMDLLQRLNDVGTTVMIASHDHALISQLGHRVLNLEEGYLVNTAPLHTHELPA